MKTTLIFLFNIYTKCILKFKALLFRLAIILLNIIPDSYLQKNNGSIIVSAIDNKNRNITNKFNMLYEYNNTCQFIHEFFKIQTITIIFRDKKTINHYINLIDLVHKKELLTNEDYLFDEIKLIKNKDVKKDFFDNQSSNKFNLISYFLGQLLHYSKI